LPTAPKTLAKKHSYCDAANPPGTERSPTTRHHEAIEKPAVLAPAEDVIVMDTPQNEQRSPFAAQGSAIFNCWPGVSGIRRGMAASQKGLRHLAIFDSRSVEAILCRNSDNDKR